MTVPAVISDAPFPFPFITFVPAAISASSLSSVADATPSTVTNFLSDHVIMLSVSRGIS